jgi:hypothetical protein
VLSGLQASRDLKVVFCWRLDAFTSETGTKQTWRDVRLESAFGGKAEVGVGQLDFRF